MDNFFVKDNLGSGFTGVKENFLTFLGDLIGAYFGISYPRRMAVTPVGSRTLPRSTSA